MGRRLHGFLVEPGPWIPGIAVPTSDKTSFECPQEQLDVFERALPNVTRLLIIGWRAAEAHVLTSLQSLQPGFRLGVVSKDEGVDELLENLGELRKRARLDLRDATGFAGAMRTPGELEAFLEAPLGTPAAYA
jgi:hypothetical protein